MSWSEDRIHRALLAGPSPVGLAGSRGHDAAVLRRIAGRPVVCVDTCVEGVHFESRVAARRVGRKVCARALSDLAATAARPRAVVLALAAARARSDAWILGAIDGVRALAREHGADLVGGDLSAVDGPTTLAVTAIGEHAARGTPPGRDRARAGQALVLTGPTGGSILGRHLAIAPRIAEGLRLHALGATAIMDVSDGLAWDLYRLARTAGVRIELDMTAVPIHRDALRLARRTGLAPWEHALHDGEDHELVATLSGPAALRAPGVVVGRVVRGAGLELRFADVHVEWQPAMGGWKHGA